MQVHTGLRFVAAGALATVAAEIYAAETPAADAADNPVSAVTAGTRQAPAVAVDADGDFVVTWQENFDIRARRYNSAGVAQGAEFTVGTGEASRPAVAMDANGNFVVVFDNFGANFDVFARRYNAAGTALGAAFMVNTFTGFDQTQPAIAMSPTGDFTIVWTSANQDASGRGVYGQRYNAAGTAQGSEFRVNTATNSDQQTPAIAMSGTGDFVVAWDSVGQDSFGNGIYAQRYTAAGAPQGGEFRVNNTVVSALAGASQRLPAIAMDADGDFVVSWIDGNSGGAIEGVFARRYLPTGVAKDVNEFRVNTQNAAITERPSISNSSLGNFVIAWQDDSGKDGNLKGILLREYLASGTAVTTGDRIVNVTTAGDQVNPDVRADNTGNFVVAWKGGANSTEFTRRFQNRPPVITSVTPLTGAAGVAILFTAAATDPEGQPLTYAWDFGDGTTGTGATPSKTFAAPGTYSVRVTVSDGILTASSTIQVVVSASGVTALDSDGDGWSDALELCLGSNPFNFSSTPFGQIRPQAGGTSTVAMLTVTRGRKPKSDRLKLTGDFVGITGVDVNGKVAIFEINGLCYGFSIDDQGFSPKGGDFMLKINRVRKSLALKDSFTLDVKKSDLSTLSGTATVTITFNGKQNSVMVPVKLRGSK